MLTCWVLRTQKKGELGEVIIPHKWIGQRDSQSLGSSHQHCSCTPDGLYRSSYLLGSGIKMVQVPFLSHLSSPSGAGLITTCTDKQRQAVSAIDLLGNRAVSMQDALRGVREVGLWLRVS